MKARLTIALLLLGNATWLPAQNTVYRTEAGTLLNLVDDVDESGPGLPNEVTVVLPPPDEEPAATEEPSSDAASTDEEKPEASDSADEETQADGETETIETPEDAAATDEVVFSDDDAPEEPKPGLSVRVESLQSGSAEIDPAQVKLLAPFPAKLLARPPEGWLVQSSESAPPFNREIELSPGKRITLDIRPHLLVVQADGSNVFEIPEPGYDASLGYRQNATVAAILSTSIRQLDDDSRQLGNVIEQLQQLLVSLPQPNNTPEPEQDSKTKSNRKR